MQVVCWQLSKNKCYLLASDTQKGNVKIKHFCIGNNKDWEIFVKKQVVNALARISPYVNIPKSQILMNTFSQISVLQLRIIT